MTKQVEGWKIGSAYHTDSEGRVVASVRNLGIPSDDWWHVESFDPATGYSVEDDWCYSYNEAVELANFFINREANRVER